MNEIVKNITKCKKCQRLVNFREKIALEKENNLLIKTTGETSCRLWR